MPCYHFTIHAYRSWSPSHPRGYTERGNGYQPSSPETAADYDDRAKQLPAIFTREVQRLLVHIAHEFCQRRKYRLHAVGNEDRHVHYALSWSGFSDWHEIARRLKNILGIELNKHFSTPSKRWFVRGASRKRVTDQKHLNHLINTYLPDHPGIFWKEGMRLP